MRLFTARNVVATGAMIAVILGVSYLLWQWLWAKGAIAEGYAQNDAILSQVQQKISVSAGFNLQDAKEIGLPRLQIANVVRLGEYDADRRAWTLDQSHVFLMRGSATPILYGHGTNEVFGRLAGAAKGEIARVVTQSGKIYIFKYTHDKMVRYDDTQVLSEKRTGEIILMTCINDQDRRLLYFTFVGEETNYERKAS